MAKPIVSVKDRAVETFSPPVLQHSIQGAIRQFSDEVNSDPATNPVARHPDDYDMYQVGEWDEETGTITPHTPEIIARAKDLKQRSA